jgi:pimeloyl-ACP methyl ester carboxylesterase
MAGDVAALIERHSLGPVALIGHSLGGKVAMRLALTRPELVERLAVVDVAPVAYAHTFGPFIEAMRQVDLAGVRRRPDADQQLQDLVRDAVLRNFVLQNLVKTDAGFVWRVNLEALAANMGELLGFPTLAADAAYRGPTLFIAGGRSHYIQAEHRPLIGRLFPKAELVVIAGAGHWPHVERPAEFLARLRPFLA